MSKQIQEYVKYFAGEPCDINLINDTTRQQLDDFATKHGQAWMGRVNLNADDTGDLVQYIPGHTVWNFAYDFAIPTYDTKLVQLIKERDSTPYTTASNDLILVTAITDLIDKLGGIHLIWA